MKKITITVTQKKDSEDVQVSLDMKEQKNATKNENVAASNVYQMIEEDLRNIKDSNLYYYLEAAYNNKRKANAFLFLSIIAIIIAEKYYENMKNSKKSTRTKKRI